MAKTKTDTNYYLVINHAVDDEVITCQGYIKAEKAAKQMISDYLIQREGVETHYVSIYKHVSDVQGTVPFTVQYNTRWIEKDDKDV